MLHSVIINMVPIILKYNSLVQQILQIFLNASQCNIGSTKAVSSELVILVPGSVMFNCLAFYKYGVCMAMTWLVLLTMSISMLKTWLMLG